MEPFTAPRRKTKHKMAALHQAAHRTYWMLVGIDGGQTPICRGKCRMAAFAGCLVMYQFESGQIMPSAYTGDGV
jgi:hypothetical protein